jgi:hypothetical protein
MVGEGLPIHGFREFSTASYGWLACADHDVAQASVRDNDLLILLLTVDRRLRRSRSIRTV